jgi:hypothetical protein
MARDFPHRHVLALTRAYDYRTHPKKHIKKSKVRISKLNSPLRLMCVLIKMQIEVICHGQTKVFQFCHDFFYISFHSYTSHFDD